MINVSEVAKSKVETLMQEDGFNPATDFVRVGVKSGGCSGLSYDLKFDKSQNSFKKHSQNCLILAHGKRATTAHYFRRR